MAAKLKLKMTWRTRRLDKVDQLAKRLQRRLKMAKMARMICSTSTRCSASRMS